LLPDQEMTHVAPGQEVEVKARAQPFRVFRGRVDRIAPRAAKSEVQSTTTVYCRLERTASELRPGMSGYARIYTGEEPIGAVLLDRILRFVRTEFWW
jgi:multidrug efflux pump subunit AcrA (membrane-fusion protein)